MAVAAGTAVAIASLGFGLALGSGPRSGTARRDAAARLSVGELAGQRIVVGFQGTHAPSGVRKLIRRGRVAGVILFASSFPSRAAGRRLIHRLQRIHRPPGLRDNLLVMIDQEGGLVKRVSGAPRASAARMGARGRRFSARQGRLTARNLLGLGVNVDLAPVLDVARPGGVIAETHRSFGGTAERVSATGVPFAAAMQAGGLAATAKHFPGLGAARGNTDYGAQRIRLPRRVLRRVDEAPYRGFIARRGSMVMLSTAIYPALSPKPAAFSREVATRELRVRLGFRGVSITDALQTGAVRAVGGPRRAALAAARSGVDLLLFTESGAAADAYWALRRKLRAGVLDRRRFERSVQRVLVLRHRATRDPN